MRNYWLVIIWCCAGMARGQFVQNSGLTVFNSSNVIVNGDWDNQNSSMTNNGSITISDNWTSTGGYDPDGAGGFVLTNTATKQFNHSQQRVGFLTKNGAGTSEVNDHLIVNSNLTLQNGLLAMNGVNDTLILLTGAQTTSNASSYLIGKMTRYGTGDLHFPMSRASDYLPITISQVAGTNPVVTVAVEDKPGGYTAGTNVTSLTNFPYVWRTKVVRGDTASYVEVQYPTSLSTPAADIVARSAAGNTYASMGMQSIVINGGATTIKSYAKGLKGLFTVAVGPLLQLDAPLSTTATNISHFEFKANWGSVISATGYQVDVSDDDFASFVSGYENVIVTETSLLVTGLDAVTEYKYRVRATGVAPTSANSSPATVTTDEVSKPGVIAASEITETGFIANWKTVDGATGYKLDVSSDNFATFATGYNSKSVGAITLAVTGLAPNTLYQYRVRAVNGSAASANSSAIEVTTLPSAPTALAASAVSTGGFTANWSGFAALVNYELEISDDGFNTLVAGYNPKTIAASATSEIVTGLKGNTAYQYRLRAINVSGSSINSLPADVTTVIVAPAVADASLVGAAGFTANWSAVAGASGYQLDVSENDFSTFLTGFNSKSVAGLSQALTSLNSNKLYKYRVRAVGVASISASSELAEVTTLAIAPTAIAATDIVMDGFTAKWNGVTGIATYQLDISSDNFSTFVNGYNSKSVSVLEKVVTGLSSSTAYKYRVRAMNASGASANSNSIDVTTLPEGPPTPTATAATNVTTTGFTANWDAVTEATEYQLDISSDNFNTFLPGYESKSSIAIAEAVIGLSANTPYKYRVRAKNTLGISVNSNVISVTTNAKANHTINFTVTTKTVGDVPFNLSATASSGLTVSYGTSTSDKVSINGSLVTILTAGKATITASQAGNDSFNPAPDISQIFCINPAKPTISISGDNTEAPTLTSSASSGNQWFKNGVSLNGATNVTLAIAGVGVYSVESTVETCKSQRSADFAIVVTGDVGSNPYTSLEISPNPGDDIVTMRLPGNGQREVKVFDLNGASIEGRTTDQNEINWNIRNYSSGYYLVRVNTPKGTYFGKFIRK